MGLFLLQKILNYSKASAAGQEFVKRLSNLTIQSTLFVPDNDGLYENEVPRPFFCHTHMHAFYAIQETNRFFVLSD